MSGPKRVPNPFRPGFARIPPILVGRDTTLAAAAEAVNVAALDAITPRPLILVGPRGVGKTVTLHEIANAAGAEHSWPTVHIEAQPRTSILEPLTTRLTATAHLLSQTKPRATGGMRVKEAKLSTKILGIGSETTLERVPGAASPTGPAAATAAFTAAAESAITSNSGFLVMIDELQLVARDELAIIGSILQEHMSENWPIVVVFAGLPTLRDTRRSVTYLERGEWHELGMLTPEQAVHALTDPASTAGRPMSQEAAEILAGAAGGYPYAIQVMGHYAWRASTGSATITARHARTAVTAGNEDLSAGLYAGRWADATDKEREYLGALAHLQVAGESTGGGDVARRLGVGVKEVSYLRDNLLKKGSVYTEGHRLRLVTPGFADWIVRTGDPDT